MILLFFVPDVEDYDAGVDDKRKCIGADNRPVLLYNAIHHPKPNTEHQAYQHSQRYILRFLFFNKFGELRHQRYAGKYACGNTNELSRDTE